MVGKNISGLKAAFKLISGLPAVQFEPTTVPVEMPLPVVDDIDSAIIQYK